MARLTIRIDLPGGGAIGPGKAKLLETIAAEGSLRRASAALGMSYRRGWMLLREIETAMGAPVVEGRSGGARGGGTALTPLGKAVLRHYRSIERGAARTGRAGLRAFDGLCRRGRSKKM